MSAGAVSSQRRFRPEIPQREQLQPSNQGTVRLTSTTNNNASGGPSGQLTLLSSKFCTVAEQQYLHKVMSTGNMKGRSTTEFYTIGKVVGVGSFAKVRLAWHKLTGQAIAIKTYEKSKIKDANHLRRIQQEIRLMEKLNHPSLIRLFETLESPKRIHLVMEYTGGGNLCSYVKKRKRLPEDEARQIFNQLCVSLEYMHDLDIIHRDVKLENVLLDKYLNTKLIDFGFSVSTKDSQNLKIFCGTPSYMAPEIVRRIEYEGKPVDCWSLGVVLYALVCGCFPFSAKSYPDLYKKVMRGQFRFPDHLSIAIKDLIRNLLQLDPKKRYNITQAKNHPWAINNGKEGRTSPPTTQTEILISANPKNDINESVIKVMEEFGIKRATTIHTILQKSHNGISACYYLLKQSMKESGDLIPDEEPAPRITIGSDGKESPTTSATKTKTVRPLSAPAGRAKRVTSVVTKPAAMEDDDDDDSFIREDNSEEGEKPKSDSVALGHLGGVSVGNSMATGSAGGGKEGGGERNENLILKQQQP